MALRPSVSPIKTARASANVTSLGGDEESGRTRETHLRFFLSCLDVSIDPFDTAADADRVGGHLP